MIDASAPLHNKTRSELSGNCTMTDIHFRSASNLSTFNTVKSTERHINQYAKLGLRTLCMAKKIISRADYNEWSTNYRAASTSLVDRDVKIQAVLSQIENNLTLIGGTALEDSLQEGVPDAIVSLREAGLNIWVLTGDKQETAINVAYSCKLITPEQRKIFINVTSSKSAEEEVRKHLRKLSNLNSKLQKNNAGRSAIRTKGDMQDHKVKHNCALIIDGVSLALVMESVSADFLQLAEQCLSVLCCRATPIQKAEVVKLVKEKLKVLTLAIGDGANDVSMIQTADVGVGISGQEGMQAVMASDFAMARFRFLKRLLLVHGHWCYDRLARTALYMFYKSAAYVFVLFWYQLFNGFSASSSVDPYYTIFHNLFYTGFPPAAVGIWDQNLPAHVLMSKPALYKSGQLCKSYQGYSYFLNILDALWQSAVVFFVTYLAYMNATVDMSEFGITCITSCVVCALCTIALENKSFNVVIWLSLLLSIVLMWLTMSLTALFAVTTDPPLNPYWVFFNTVASPLYWLCIILSTVAAIVPRLFIRAFKATIRPSPSSVERQLVVNSKNSSLSRFRCDSEWTGFPGSDPASCATRRASEAHGRSKSSKCLRELPMTTHIAHIPTSVSRSVPLLDRTLSEDKTIFTFDRKPIIEVEV